MHNAEMEIVRKLNKNLKMYVMTKIYFILTTTILFFSSCGGGNNKNTIISQEELNKRNDSNIEKAKNAGNDNRLFCTPV